MKERMRSISPPSCSTPTHVVQSVEYREDGFAVFTIGVTKGSTGEDSPLTTYKRAVRLPWPTPESCAALAIQYVGRSITPMKRSS